MVAEALRIPPIDAEASEILRNAFGKFHEASSKLETRYQELKRETEELRQQLVLKDLEVKRAEKMALLGETAAALAHEVRNPLGAIRLFLSVLRQDLADRPMAIGTVDQIERSVVSLDHVVSNMLLFAKDKKLELVPLNVHAIIFEQAQLIENRAPGVLTVQCHLHGTPFIRGNEHALRQIFYNLLLNASQAMRHRGTIMVGSAERADGLEVQIQDGGPGIAPQVFSTLFEPFVTTKQEGTGLGLAIVRKLIQEHGGTIAAQNAGGAVFTIHFPHRTQI